jgi:hypothetical protein
MSAAIHDAVFSSRTSSVHAVARGLNPSLAAYAGMRAFPRLGLRPVRQVVRLGRRGTREGVAEYDRVQDRLRRTLGP